VNGAVLATETYCVGTSKKSTGRFGLLSVLTETVGRFFFFFFFYSWILEEISFFWKVLSQPFLGKFQFFLFFDNSIVL